MRVVRLRRRGTTALAGGAALPPDAVRTTALAGGAVLPTDVGGTVEPTTLTDQGAVLAHARSSTFAVGERESRPAGAVWALLLPSLELETVLCVGVPSVAALSMLSRLSETVAIACGGPDECARVTRRSATAGLANVTAFCPADPLPLLGQVDLAVISGGRAAARLSAGGWLGGTVAEARAVFVDLGGGGMGSSASAHVHRLTASLGPMHVMRLTPSSGEVRTVAPAGDAPTLAYLDGLAAADAPGRTADVRNLARRAGRLRHSGSRSGALVLQGGRADRFAPPAYVSDIAELAGVPIADHRVGLSAPSDDASRKAMLFLFAPERDEPEYVVKLTREAAYNDRLENEWRALRLLDEAGLGGSGLVPRPAFFGHHAGLALLGQSALQGTPFRRRTTARPDCLHARRAADWLLELGSATAHPAPDNELAALSLRDLLARFGAIYGLTGDQFAYLDGQIDVIEQHPEALPLVFQHGDPGTWNLLVTEDDRPAFLDWEAAEPDGMPLWDLFYFVRSFAVSVARVAGVGSTLSGFGRQLLRDQPVNRLLVDAVERTCDDLGLARELVEPLFLTCWVHRALKEAGGLAPGRLDSGHYVNLVRLCIDRSDAPGLRRLYGTA